MKLPTAFLTMTVVAVAFIPVVSQGQVIDVGPGESIAANTQLPDGATVNINGGSIGQGVELIDGTLNVINGEVALNAISQATGFNNVNNTVNVRGGEVGGFFQLRNGSELNLSGGVIESFGVLSNSTATITGGEVTVFPDIVSGLVNIRGGNVASVRVFDDGAVNIFGSEFFIDGVLVDDLAVGETRIISQRNVDLAATLEDGSFFDVFLDSTIRGLQPDAATFNSTVMITGVASLVILGDLNDDGNVSFLDISPFIDVLSGNATNEAADINQDGTADLLDISPFIELLLGS